MKRTLFPLLLMSVVIYSSLQAQVEKSTTRIERQHSPTRFLRERLNQTEQSLVLSLKGSSVDARRTAIQTLRDLEQLFPDYPFAAMIPPMEIVLKDEYGDPLARMLAALALDELHSDAGDAVIKSVADKCDDKGLQTLCQSLLVKSAKNKD